MVGRTFTLFVAAAAEKPDNLNSRAVSCSCPNVVTEVPRMKKCVTVLDIIQQLLQRCSIGFLNEEIE